MAAPQMRATVKMLAKRVRKGRGEGEGGEGGGGEGEGGGEGRERGEVLVALWKMLKELNSLPVAAVASQMNLTW